MDKQVYLAGSLLPSELIIIILKYVYIEDSHKYLTHLSSGESASQPLETPREQLKKLRLEGRAFCDAVTPSVFNSLHIHASALSITRAELVSQSYLSVYVQEIVCHEGSFFDQSSNQKDFSRILYSHARRQDYPWQRSDLVVKEHQLFSNYLEEVKAASLFQEINVNDYYRMAFHRICQNSPNLKTFVIMPYLNEWADPETSSYTLRRTGWAYLPTTTQWPTCQWFLEVMQDFEPEILNLALFHNKLSSMYVARSQNAAGSNSMTKLRKLKIGPSYDPKYGAYRTEVSAISGITPFLALSKNLTQLELINDVFLHRMSPLILPGMLLNLTHLKFSVGPYSNAAFWLPYSLLASISNPPALKHLEFDGIGLVLNTWTDLPPLYTPPSIDNPWISNLIILSWHISLKTKLETCVGLSTIRSSKDYTKVCSNHVLGVKPGKEVLCKKLSEAICHKRKWPTLMNESQRNGPESLSSERLARYRGFLNSSWEWTVDEFDPHGEEVKEILPSLSIKTQTSVRQAACQEYHRALRDLC